MSKDEESQTEPVVIKKYANRRLYNTDTSSYVTLDDLAEMVRAERDFSVHDAKSGEDLTHSVLTQIIFEQESKGQNLLPIRFLRQLIRFYGDSIERIVPSYLEFSLDSLTRQQDKYRKQFSGAFAAPPFEAIQEHAKQNMAMFEKALGMFNPYTGAGGEDAGNQQSKPDANNASDAPGDVGGTEESSGELETLKAEMSAMQDKLDQISKRSS